MRDYKLRKKVYNDYATKEDLENAGDGDKYIHTIELHNTGTLNTVICFSIINDSPDAFTLSTLKSFFSTNKFKAPCSGYIIESSSVTTLAAISHTTAMSNAFFLTGVAINLSGSSATSYSASVGWDFYSLYADKVFAI